jgi:cation transport regulator ChaC
LQSELRLKKRRALRDLYRVGTWIFGYGSLIFRPGFEYLEARWASVEGWQRKFWQASPDHRGTPSAPGRVATLIQTPGVHCWGRAYRIADESSEEILARLDHREKAGYEQVIQRIRFQDGALGPQVLFYVAGPQNPNFVGPLSEEEIVAVARHSVGPSGRNAAYIQLLAKELRAAGLQDAHVERLDALLNVAEHTE